jgi:hypothetical protein
MQGAAAISLGDVASAAATVTSGKRESSAIQRGSKRSERRRRRAVSVKPMEPTIGLRVDPAAQHIRVVPLSWRIQIAEMHGDGIRPPGCAVIRRRQNDYVMQVRCLLGLLPATPQS